MSDACDCCSNPLLFETPRLQTRSTKGGDVTAWPQCVQWTTKTETWTNPPPSSYSYTRTTTISRGADGSCVSTVQPNEPFPSNMISADATYVVTYEGTGPPNQTLSELVSLATANIGDYEDGGDAYFFAYKTSESPLRYGSVSVKKMQWRIAHYSSITCFLKVWFVKRFIPQNGSEHILTDLSAPYEWQPQSPSCYVPPAQQAIPTPFGPIFVDAPPIFSPYFDEEVPSEQGRVQIEVSRFSLLPNYEPPTDGSANGFPNPS